MAGSAGWRLSRGWLARRGWVAVVLLIVAGGWWLVSPRAMRLVSHRRLAVHPVSGYTCQYACRPSGVLVYEVDNAYASYRIAAVSAFTWEGQLRWTVRLASPVKARRDAYINQVYQRMPLAVSPDGRWLAVVTPRRTAQQVTTYRDGRLTSQVSIPAAPLPAIPAIDDRGCVRCWYPGLAKTPLLVIEGGRMTARGAVPLPPGAGRVDAAFTSDGTAFLAVSEPNLTYYRLQRRGDVLQATPTFTSIEDTSGAATVLPWVADGGLLVGNSGARYAASGALSKATNWQLLNADHQPGGTAVLQGRTVCGDAYPDILMSGVRVYDARSGKAWSNWPPRYHRYGAAAPYATPDGRFALVDIHPRAIHAKGKDYLDWLPVVGDVVGEAYYCRHPASLSLYERPGRLRARLKTQFDITYGFLVRDGARPASFVIAGGALSPDGHTFSTLVLPKEGKDGEAEVWRWRW